MGGMSGRIWSYGIAMLDVVLSPIDTWPRPGGLIVCDQGAFVPGGVALNTALTVAKLGGPSGLIAVFGEDAVAAALERQLSEAAVDTCALVRIPGASTGFCVVGVTSGGEKSLIAHLGANALLGPDVVAWDLLAPGDHFHIGGVFGLPQLRDRGLAEPLERARRRGLTTSVETTWDVSGRWLEGVKDSLGMVDVLMTNTAEAVGMTGETDPGFAAAALAELGPAIAVVKADREGSWVAAEGKVTHVTQFEVDVVDSTGAGDAYCGGFLYGRRAGWEVVEAARFGNAVGAMNCTSVGATAGVRTAAETLAFMGRC